jgi:hypothetical protein
MELFEKYFILYDSLSMDEYELAAQYLWLFQKLNAANLASIVNEKTETEAADKKSHPQLNLLISFFSSCNSVISEKLASAVSKQNNSALDVELKMNMRMIITIYTANSLVNEAYELVKPHLRRLYQGINSDDDSSIKISKDLVVHFLNEADRLKNLKNVIKISSLDPQLKFYLFNYLEAKQELDSICIAIELHVNSRNYIKAVDLFDRYSKQITNSSSHSYLSSMCDVAKQMLLHREKATLGSGISTANRAPAITGLALDSNPQKAIIITYNDIKESQNFVYRFMMPLGERYNPSKRCLKIFENSEDNHYVKVLKMPELIFSDNNLASNTTTPMNTTILTSNTAHDKLTESAFIPSLTPYSMLKKSILTSSFKRKASTSTPQTTSILGVPSPSKRQSLRNIETPSILKSSLGAHDTATGPRLSQMGLVSSLSCAKSTSVIKSVKFQISKSSKRKTEEDDDEEHESNEEFETNGRSAKKANIKLFDDDEEQDKTATDKSTVLEQNHSNLIDL